MLNVQFEFFALDRYEADIIQGVKETVDECLTLVTQNMSADEVKAKCVDKAKSELNVGAATFPGSVELQKISVSTLMTDLRYTVCEN